MPYYVAMNEQIKSQQNLVDMAKKRRHLHLVEKLARGKSSTPSLSKAELKELEQFEKDPKSPGIVDTQEKVAKAFGISDRTVRYWIKDGMPITNHGTFDLTEIQAWRFIRNKKKQSAGGRKNNIEEWDVKYREYKARLAEIALKKEMELLIPRERVEKDLIRISLTIKRRLLMFPRTVAPQLTGLETRQIEAILAARIKEIIIIFATGEIFAKRVKKDAKGVDIIAEDLDGANS